MVIVSLADTVFEVFHSHTDTIFKVRGTEHFVVDHW